MANTLINDAEVNALFDNLFDLLGGDERTAFLERVGERVGVYGESLGREYPERKEGIPLPAVYNLDGRPSKFKSRKQRAFVMRLVLAGKVPRTRTGFLGNSITHAVTVADTGVIVRVGTNLAGAEFVIGSRGTQNTYLRQQHDWQPLDEKIEQHKDDIRGVIVTATKEELVKKVTGK